MRSALSVGVCLLAVGCGPRTTVSPKSGSSFGHFEVTVTQLELASLEDPLTVTVGGIPTYGVTREASDTVRFTVQGSPQSGPNEVVVLARNGEARGGVLVYDPALDPRLARMVSLGASLSMGMQSAGISPHGQLHAPAAVVARSAGTFLGLPLMKAGYFDGLVPADLDPTTCWAAGDAVSIIAGRLSQTLIPKISDRDGNMAIKLARQTPTLETRNLAIGGFTLEQALSGSGGGLEGLLEHFVWEPDIPSAQIFDAAHQTGNSANPNRSVAARGVGLCACA